MLTKTQMASAEKALSAYLLRHYGTTVAKATEVQLYYALAAVAQINIYEKRGKCFNEKNVDKKTVHYMCIEFLIGKNLRNNLWNLELEGFYRDLLKNNNKKCNIHVMPSAITDDDISALLAGETPEEDVEGEGEDITAMDDSLDNVDGLGYDDSEYVSLDDEAEDED